MNRIFYLIIPILLAACQNGDSAKTPGTGSIPAIKEPKTGTSIAEKLAANALLNLETFTTLPDTLTGCTGLYSHDSIPLESRRYQFITNLDGMGILQQSGKVVYLQRGSRKELPGGEFEEIFSGEGFTVILRTKETGKTGDELSVYSGTLEVRKNGLSRVLKVHGEVGC